MNEKIKEFESWLDESIYYDRIVLNIKAYVAIRNKINQIFGDKNENKNN